MAELDDLTNATRHYLKAKTAYDHAREEVSAAAVAALKAGYRPTDVTAFSPFTSTYVRRLAREAGIEPAKPGPKSSK